MSTIATTILGFFKGLSWQVYAAVAALALLGGTVWYCSEQIEDKVEQAEVIGRTEERNEQLERTLENVQKAEEARDEITDPSTTGDRTRYNQCLRTARTPANCERMRIVQED